MGSYPSFDIDTATSADAVKEYFENAEPAYQHARATFVQAILESHPELNRDVVQTIADLRWGTAAIQILAPPTVLISAVSHFLKNVPSLPASFFLKKVFPEYM